MILGRETWKSTDGHWTDWIKTQLGEQIKYKDDIFFHVIC